MEPVRDGRVVLCQAGTGRYALPVTRVVEIMRPLPVERLTGTPPHVLGVSVIRGAPVPVVDVAMLVHGEAGRGNRLVTVRTGEGDGDGTRVVALFVDAVAGVGRIPPGSLDAMPSLLDGARVDALGAADRQALLMLDAAKAVPESVWAAL